METRMQKHAKRRREIKEMAEKEEAKLEETIKAIQSRCRVIRNIYRDAYPKARYLSICIVEGSIYISNEYWGRDVEFPIDVIETVEDNDDSI